jgi:hypothetical protein
LNVTAHDKDTKRSIETTVKVRGTEG